MKKNIEITMRAIILIIIVSLIVGALIVLSVYMIANIKTSGKDYLSAIVGGVGGVIGSFIGAIVAYIVAAYQVQKTFELDKRKGQSGNYAVLRLVKVEIDTNHRLLSSSKSQYFAGRRDLLVGLLGRENWEKCSTLIGQEVEDTVVSQLSSVYRKMRLLESETGMPEQTYDRLVSDLSICSSLLDTALNQLKN
ncbi:hypothetical protein AMQ84_06425 [Paenibacillus riograndensis]|uniref:Uncharacterized protein n=1 Tax=Paenibacillus riograndensis TaxID=483937 RepID=A0A132U7H0_9BACL|nr:hypothetical protein [Paenibacillus riograndensis]KWX79547.1 hypothetical protein AMQ84_06425 [Paenibacillus riograndensis]